MLKTKKILVTLMLLMAVLLLPNMVNAEDAAITVERNIYSMDGSMKFTFSGLTIDSTHEYAFGLTKTTAATVEDWYLITESTETSLTANVMTGTATMREVINNDDVGYITIKDQTADVVIVEPYAVDLKLPYLRVTNYVVLNNGQNLNGQYEINVPLRNASNSEAYYKYEKITDENFINKYKEIKANDGDYIELESMVKENAPINGYSTWGYWNGYGNGGRNGFGYTTNPVNAPDTGLYYLWVYFSGESIKNLYGCIIVDNLQPEIKVDSVSLPATKTVKLGETITLAPTFNPTTATNKIVTWESSDESVATVNNAGKVTPKKVGSTIIKVTSQDGNKTATCTVTVTGETVTPQIDTKTYISFPYIIYNGESSVSLKSGAYNGNYTMYYQFVEISDEVFNKVEDLQTKYKNGKITYEEYFEQYNNTVTKYNDSKWIKTEDGKFKQDLTKFEGTKKFALWVKLVMDDKTVYESQIYTMDGSGKASNLPEQQNKPTTTEKPKDTTTSKDKLPDTGKVILLWTIAIVTVSAVVAHIRYKKLYIK